MARQRAGWVVLAAALMLCVGLQSSAEAGRSAMVKKVFFSATKIKDVADKELVRLFRTSKPTITLTKADKRWKAVMVAFFRKPAIPGPITIWVYDKSDKAAIKAKEPTQILTAQGNAKRTFVYDLELHENDGFNRNRTYLIWVGQIVNKRSRIYARGSVSLK